MLGKPVFHPLAVPSDLFASISVGGFGFGAAFVETPILVLLVEAGIALAALPLQSILIDPT